MLKTDNYGRFLRFHFDRSSDIKISFKVSKILANRIRAN